MPRYSSGTAHQNTPLDLRHEAPSSVRDIETRRIPPLMEDIAIPVYPMLAKTLGINEAVVIQQIYFHINVKANSSNSNHFYEGRWWVYNSYQQWCDNHFPWLTPRGLQAIMMNLEEKGILLSVQSLGNRWDRRKWYTLNLKVLEAILQNASMHHTKNASSKIHFLHDDSTKSTTETLNINTSRSEALEQEKLTETPDGDVCVGDQFTSNNMPEWEVRAEQPHSATATLVEGHDSFQQSKLQNQAESLPGPRRAVPHPATPMPRPITPQTATQNIDRSAAPHESHSISPSHPSDSRSKPPAAPNLRSSVSGSDGSHSASSPVPSMSAMQKVVVHALKIYSGHAGKIAQFFKGTVPRNRKDLWAYHQPDIPATPQEVLALLLWYRQNPAYAVSFINHGSKLPSTPAVLRDRLDEFRSSPDYDRILGTAQPLLERLLRGENIAQPVAEAPIGRVESAAAYKPYDSRNDPAYQNRKIETMSQDDIQKLLGMQK